MVGRGMPKPNPRKPNSINANPDRSPRTTIEPRAIQWRIPNDCALLFLIQVIVMKIASVWLHPLGKCPRGR